MVKKAILTGLALLLTSGCASRDYVREQVDLVRQGSETKILNLENELSQYKQKFASCFDGKYDYDKRCIDSTKEDMEMTRGVYPLVGGYYLKDKDGKRINRPILVRGTGILLKNNYVLTARHVIDENFPNKKLNFYGNTLDVKILAMGHEGHGVSLEIVKVSKKYDLALLKMEDKAKLNKTKVDLGNSNELKRGNLLYLIGNLGGMGIHQHQAIVSTYEDETLREDGYNGTFNINTSLGSGYSGGPVFAIKDAKFELIGIISSTTTFNAQIISINHALEEFKEYLQK